MKRHEFEMIAAAIRDGTADAVIEAQDTPNADPEDAAKRGARCVAEAIADALARGTAPGGNRSFDRELFLRNAGVQS